MATFEAGDRVRLLDPSTGQEVTVTFLNPAGPMKVAEGVLAHVKGKKKPVWYPHDVRIIRVIDLWVPSTRTLIELSDPA